MNDTWDIRDGLTCLLQALEQPELDSNLNHDVVTMFLRLSPEAKKETKQASTWNGIEREEVASGSYRWS